MYKIDEENLRETNHIIIPATLDYNFPLIKYMFWSKDYSVEILDSKGDGIIDQGLPYINNEICFPCVLMVGQIMDYLKKSTFPKDKTFVLMPTAGDACRGANYIGLVRRALQKAGYSECGVLTINVRHVEDQINLPLNLDMAIRGLFGLMYGDILMLLANQVRPYEKTKGDTDEKWQKWTDILADDLKSGKNLTLSKMYHNFDRICKDFASIEKIQEAKQVIAIVGEFYAKYCSLGNWDAIKYIEEKGCESFTNGLSWYMLYYIESHVTEATPIEKMGFLAAKALMAKAQNKMIASLKKYGFHSLPGLKVIKEHSRELVNQNLKVGDGWLLGAEVIGCAENGLKKILCIAPFGCIANVCAGRGLYPYLQRNFKDAEIVSVETDSSASKMNYYNRIQMLIDWQ